MAGVLAGNVTSERRSMPPQTGIARFPLESSRWNAPTGDQPHAKPDRQARQDSRLDSAKLPVCATGGPAARRGRPALGPKMGDPRLQVRDARSRDKDGLRTYGAGAGRR